jgi:hypothetical protein
VGGRQGSSGGAGGAVGVVVRLRRRMGMMYHRLGIDGVVRLFTRRELWRQTGTLMG